MLDRARACCRISFFSTSSTVSRPNVAGGNAGLAEALEKNGHARRVFVITHETNSITLPLVVGGMVNFLIAQSPVALLKTALWAAQASEVGGPEYHHLDFTIHTKFNIPAVDDLSAV